MRDINFFEPYIGKKGSKLDNKIITFTLSTFIILLIIAYIVYNAVIIKQESEIVEILREMSENPMTMEKVEFIKTKETKVSEFRDYVVKIKQLDSIIERKDVVDESFLDIITSKVPKNLFLTSISIKGGDIHLIGISKDKWAIAELQKGLEDLSHIEEIFVSNISFSENYYNFNVNVRLKGVDTYGEESAEKEEK
ncbi:PilN domain-containing protein [Tissierella sp.]|uniref:PilN domain-containing protein n=1 Tax=Tissierella sp. TaxID=41274 RepID=UPI002862D462|nr:PilN domain-containing protein [Tissierella sp.]MDR7856126.1 PilN domain-containing protein [Tissierella sp.]